MPKFKCRMGTAAGDVTVEEFTAPNAGSLRSQLEDKGYFVFSIKPANRMDRLAKAFAVGTKKIKLRDFLVFNQEFAALLNAGLPVLTALDLVLGRRREGNFQRLLQQVRDDVQSGASLSDSFANRGKAFPSIYPATLAAGERSGELVGVIKRYLFYLKTVDTIRKKILSAIIYPIILLVLSVILITILMVFIVPAFSKLFTDMSVSAKPQLPALTRGVMAVSSFMRVSWPFLLLLIAGAVIGIKLMTATPYGRLMVAKIRLRLPVIGQNIKRYNIAQMCRTLGILVSGGIPIITALEVLTNAMANEVYKVELAEVKRKVLEGQSLWASLEKTSLVTPMVVEMIEVGESTGALAEMLDQISNFYDEELSTSVERFVALLEPMLLLVMAVVIALVVLSVYMPMFSMIGSAGAG